MWFLHWLVHITGSDYGLPYGKFSIYDFLSGFCGASFLGVGLIWYRKHNCEVHSCWRIGRHATAAGHLVCRKHHPDGKLTHQDVLDAHAAAKES